MPHITVLVSNDLQHDQRVAKVCETLLEMDYSITLVGRMMKGSTPMKRPYKTVRFKLWFDRGALFYAALNIRLFFYLLFVRTDAILSNDLDTLLPAYLIAKLRGKKLYYDSHEYFTEAEGLTGRLFQKKVWLFIESRIFPKLKHVYTVNRSIAEIYRNKYHVEVNVVRNIPRLIQSAATKSRKELNLPEDKKLILLQGAYIDPDRGGVELVKAMQYVDDVFLLIIGSGRDIERIKTLIHELKLSEKIRLYPKMPADQLRVYTVVADLGLSLDKPLHLNYTLSLPNKLFDYIHAGVPVLVSNLPELKAIVDSYQVGITVDEVTPEKLAVAIKEALNHPEYYSWKSNCLVAREKLNWQIESEVLKQIYRND